MTEPRTTPSSSTPSSSTPSSTELHVIAGKGPVGGTTARLLADAGKRVRVLSRSGAPAGHSPAGHSPAGHNLIEHVAVDVSDAAAVGRDTAEATVSSN
jgi:2-polyprenyl-6-methoxyphenol hydroxylase-like FAD-dependent oxidoreductase